jgi:hypothetical protein
MGELKFREVKQFSHIHTAMTSGGQLPFISPDTKAELVLVLFRLCQICDQREEKTKWYSQKKKKLWYVPYKSNNSYGIMFYLKN